MAPAAPPDPALGAASPHPIAPTPAHYDVDARGQRVPSRAAKAPGAPLVRFAALLDVGALLGFVVHLALTIGSESGVVLFVGAASPVLPLVFLDLACASGMEDMALRVRRIVGVFVPGLLIAAIASRGRMPELLAASINVQLPLLTLPFGAFAAHRALGLAEKARERAAARRRAPRVVAARAARLSTREFAGAMAAGTWGGAANELDVRAASAGGAAPGEAGADEGRATSAFSRVVLVSGVALIVAGAYEATHRLWWFGLVGMAAGVLCVARSRDFGAPTSERRLRRADRAGLAIWALAPIGALLALVRFVWLLTNAG